MNRSLSLAVLLIVPPSLPATALGGEAPAIRNVLYLMADDLRASVLGCYGDSVCETPNLDRLAQRSTVFTHAYCQSPLCAPSRPSILFSRYGRANIDPVRHKSFPQLLKENGWFSARVGKIFHMDVPRNIVDGTDGRDYPRSWSERYNCSGAEESTPGLYQCLNTNDIRRGLENRQGAGTKNRMYVAVQADGDGTDQPDHEAASKAIELLRANREKPFLLAVGFVRPHYPHVAPAPLFDHYPYERVSMPLTITGDWDDIPPAGIPRKTNASTGLGKYPDNQKRMWSAYHASVEFMDTQVGRVLDELDRLGLRETTAVIFTSDHGYNLGDHGFWEKEDLHEQATRVPLMVSRAGADPAVSDAVVELTDIYPTVADLVGLETPDSCVGVSLAPVLADPAARVRDAAFTYLGRPPSRKYALRGERWAYMQYEDGEELYDMRSDPEQFTNLAADQDYAEVLQKLRTAMALRAAALAGDR